MIDIICHDLEKFGIKKQDTNSYIELVTYFRQGLNKNMAETGSSINILNQYIDWSSLIR
jgi:hypothetical protein